LRKKQGPAGLKIPAGMVFSGLGVLICLGLLTRIEYEMSVILIVAVAVALVNWVVVRGRKAISVDGAH